MPLSEASALEPESRVLKVEPLPHVHLVDEVCPVCEQPLPPDRLDEIKQRIEAHERERAAEITAGLQAQFARERAVAVDAAIAREKQAAVLREAVARAEGRQAAEVALQERMRGIEQAKVNAEARATAAEQQARLLKETQEADFGRRLQEQRAVLEREKTDAVNAQKSTFFEEKLKLSSKIEELQRTIDKKTAEELGEGAEIDLFEALKSAFETDRVERINRGQPGADILHTVIHNGKECGKIVYDSKNHNAWRNEFVTKLSADQMAARAEHAVLSTRKFPSGARQLVVQDGVILASPSRVVAVVEIVRQHLIQTHTLRLSNDQRSTKTAALYSFITSERCADLFARIDTHADDLLELQTREMRAHQNTWNRQGELLRSIQKVRGELCNEIDVILGTAGLMDEAQT